MKPQIARNRRLSALIWLLIALLIPSVASANAVPTPEFLIRFAAWPAGDVQIVGAQLQGCAEPSCATADLLVHQGECAGSPCLTGPAAYGAGLYPLPTGGRAVAFGLPVAADPPRPWDSYARYRLVTAFNDAVRASAPFERQGYTSYYTADLAGAGLALRPYEQYPASTVRTAYVVLNIALYLGFNLLSEPAGVALVAWRCRLPRRGRLLAASLLINLISFPIVWGVFPAFSPFAGAGDIGLAWASLGFLAAACAVAAGLSTLPGLGRGRQLALLAAAVPLLWGALAMAYAPLAALPLPSFPSLSTSPLLNLALVEAAVVLVEGWLYHRLSGGDVRLREGLLVALVANLISLSPTLLIALASSLA